MGRSRRALYPLPTASATVLGGKGIGLYLLMVGLSLGAKNIIIRSH